MVPVFLLALAATAAPLRRHGGGPSGLSDPLWALKRARHFVPVPGRATAPSEATYARHGRKERTHSHKFADRGPERADEEARVSVDERAQRLA